jgi:Zn-dependent peptidase ImmA (M78 family)
MMFLGARGFKQRMLFTVAHELGHLVAHHNDQATGYAHFDQASEFGSKIDGPKKQEEWFADAFGSALLMPRHGLLLTLKQIREQIGAKGPLGDIEIAWLAHLFHVSFEVAARRCESLGLIPPRGARAFYQQLVKDYKNPENRARALGIPARPELYFETSPALMRIAVEKVQSGSISIGRVAELLNVPVTSIFVANAEIVA